MGRSDTVYEFLERRERELTHELAGLRGEVDVREKELAHVRSARRQIDLLGANDAADFGKPKQISIEGVSAKGIAGEIKASVGHEIKKADAQYDHLTIKELILKAMDDHFHNGATAIELREFIKNAYGRDIDRASLTPQMSRLRDEGILEYLPRSEDGDGPGDRFIVARAFNSTVRRFPVGAEIVIPADPIELSKLKLEFEPLQVDDLIERRWIVRPSSGGYWKLSRDDDPLNVARLVLNSLWADQDYRNAGANRAQMRESIKRSGVDLSEQQIADAVRLLNSTGLLKNKGGPQNWRLTVKAVEALSQDRKPM